MAFIHKHQAAAENSGRTTDGGSFSVRKVDRGLGITLFALGALWLEFFNELRGEWDVNPQYSYGYVVPLLGAMLLWRRWPERPEGFPVQNKSITIILIGLIFCLLPLRIILEANPEWRLA